MTSELRDLYQEVILEHNKQPRNFQRLSEANHHAEGYNPLCGDRITVYLDLQDDVIRNVAFQGSGCAISKASASLMTTVVKGKNCDEVKRLFEAFQRMVTGKCQESLDAKLEVFSGVCEFPARVKCASLAWHTLKAALEGRGEPVKTE